MLEKRPFIVDVIGLGQGAIDFKVVAPAGELDTVIAHGFNFGSQFSKGKIGPLAGKQGDGSWHNQI